MSRLSTMGVETSRQARRALIVLYASIQFVVLTVIAMLVYPGGAVYKLDSDHYLFLQNFFSDLGATVTPSGHSNTASHLLFIVALVSVGVALVQFSPSWSVIVHRRNRGRLIGIAAQWLIVIAGLGFIGIAATPWNRVLDAHNAFVQAAFGFLLLYVLCLLVIQLQNGWPHVFTALNAIHVAGLLAYMVILVAGPRLSTENGLLFQVAAQKVIVYASILNLGAQAFGVRREARQLPSAPDS